MKDLDFYSFESLSASELSEKLTEQAKQNVKSLQTPTATGYMPQLVIPSIVKQETSKPPQNAIKEGEASSDLYYIAVNNDSKGPFSNTQIKEYLTAGLITPDTLCWKEGFETWLPISSVETLK
jgi:hypothetical protein